MTVEFKKIKTTTQKDQFISQIERMIISGDLKIGSRLPSERVLSEKMSVSRSVVNSGLAELARRGFVEIKPRVGNFVADFIRKGSSDVLLSIMQYSGDTLPEAETKSLVQFLCTAGDMVIKVTGSHLSEEDYRCLSEHREQIYASSTPAEAAEKTYCFYHELALVSGNTIAPLLYASFRPVFVNLWERYARKNGIDGLYGNCRMLLDYIRNGETEKAEEWIQSCADDMICGESGIIDN